MNQKTGQASAGFIGALAKFTSRVNSLFVKIAGVLVLAMTILIVQDVIRRYFFNDPSAWTFDITRFMLVYVVFLAIAPALQGGQHVSMDIMNEFMSERMQHIVKNISLVLIMIFGAVFFWKLLGVTWNTFLDNRLFPIQLPIQMKYVYWIAPVGILQFVLTALSLLLQSLKGGRRIEGGPV